MSTLSDAKRLSEIAKRALNEWSGWLDDSRGTVDHECEAMKKEVNRISERLGQEND